MWALPFFVFVIWPLTSLMLYFYFSYKNGNDVIENNHTGPIIFIWPLLIGMWPFKKIGQMIIGVGNWLACKGRNQKMIDQYNNETSYRSMKCSSCGKEVK